MPESFLLQLQLRMQCNISFFQCQVLFSPAFSTGKRVGGKTTDEIESLESLALSSQMQDIRLSLDSFRNYFLSHFKSFFLIIFSEKLCIERKLYFLIQYILIVQESYLKENLVFSSI